MERVFLRKLQDFARDSVDKGLIPQVQENMILRAGASCMFTTEKALRRLLDVWRPMRNKLVHGIPLTTDERDFSELQIHVGADEQLEIDDLPTAVDIQSREFLRMYRILEDLLVEVDEVPVDSKLDAMVNHLREKWEGREAPHLLIWALFASTVDYLTSALGTLEYGVHSFTGSMDSATRARNVDRYREEGGLLIATDAAAPGVQVGVVNECINWDLPSSLKIFERRLSGLYRSGQQRELVVVNLKDTSGSSLWEETALQKVFETPEGDGPGP